MARKKTHEEYVEELSIKNPTIKVIEKYKGANIKITHFCMLHKIHWDITPINALNGNGCEQCRKDKFARIRTKTHQQHLLELKKITSTIIPLEQYIDAKTPILYKCLTHNIEWSTIPHNVIKGCGCKECGKEKIRNKLSKSHKEYLEELNTLNSNLTVLEEYKGASIPILHKCVVDGYEWKARPANILYGKGCPKCAGHLKRTHNEYIEFLQESNPAIRVLEEYVNARTPIKHECTVDGYIWTTPPQVLLMGCGCPKCGHKRIGLSLRKSHSEYINEVKLINSNIEVVDDYVMATYPILHKCLIDGYKWKAHPINILRGSGCPKCNTSKGEKRIEKWLTSHSFNYEVQKRFKDCRDVKTLPFDFYLPDEYIAIEYDGEQHYRAIDYFGGEERLEYVQKHDTIKTKYCEDNGIKLLRIPYYKNIEEELNNFLFI